jgi:hypothetical protein
MGKRKVVDNQIHDFQKIRKRKERKKERNLTCSTKSNVISGIRIEFYTTNIGFVVFDD